MNKIGLIIRREYTTRIRNKTFLISTFLLPFMIVLLIAGTVYLGIKGKTSHRIAVEDENGYFKELSYTVVISSPVPTLPQWSALLLAAGLLSLGYLRLRRRSAGTARIS